MVIVENDPVRVEADLAAGRVGCPACGGVLARWWFARGAGCALGGWAGGDAATAGSVPFVRDDAGACCRTWCWAGGSTRSR